jgi:hypothetical protein
MAHGTRKEQMGKLLEEFVEEEIEFEDIGR